MNSFSSGGLDLGVQKIAWLSRGSASDEDSSLDAVRSSTSKLPSRNFRFFRRTFLPDLTVRNSSSGVSSYSLSRSKPKLPDSEAMNRSEGYLAAILAPARNGGKIKSSWGNLNYSTYCKKYLKKIAQNVCLPQWCGIFPKLNPKKHIPNEIQQIGRSKIGESGKTAPAPDTRRVNIYWLVFAQSFFYNSITYFIGVHLFNFDDLTHKCTT